MMFKAKFENVEPSEASLQVPSSVVAVSYSNQDHCVYATSGAKSFVQINIVYGTQLNDLYHNGYGVEYVC